jgi:hypothetical protein
MSPHAAEALLFGAPPGRGTLFNGVTNVSTGAPQGLSRGLGFLGSGRCCLLKMLGHALVSGSHHEHRPPGLEIVHRFGNRADFLGKAVEQANWVIEPGPTAPLAATPSSYGRKTSE